MDFLVYFKLIYYIYYNYLVLSSLYFGNYDKDKLYIISTLFVYESINFIISVFIKPDTILMKLHHLFSAICIFITYFYYIDNEVYNDFIWGAICLIMSNIWLTIMYLKKVF